MDEGELLEPISLSGGPGSKGSSTSRFRGGWLMLLLGLWTLGVYGFLGREDNGDAESPPPSRVEVEDNVMGGESAETVIDLPTPAPVPTPPAPDRLRVVSDPSAATVLLDGAFAGMTPLEMDRPGAGRRLAFRKSGYEPVDVNGDAWREGSEVKVTLKPVTGRVRISVSPPQTTLWMDGTELQLPEDGIVELPLRRHRIKAVAPGYEEMEIEVLPALAYERQIQVELKVAPANGRE